LRAVLRTGARAKAEFGSCGLVALRAFGVFGAGVEGFDDGGDAAAGAEVADDFGPDGVAGFDDVVEDLIDDVFLEDAEVAVGEEVLLEGLELEAGFAGHVADGEAAEVGKAGLGADGGELGVVDEDLVGLELVAPGFDGGELGVEASGGVVVGVAGGFGFGGHRSILEDRAAVAAGGKERRVFGVGAGRAEWQWLR
jgi:hypothetical protein